MVCRLPLTITTVLGLESARSLPPGQPGNDLRLGFFFSGSMLLFMCFRTLLWNRAPDARRSPLRLIVALYAGGTGLFAWSRAVWDTSKMLLCLAAIHNLCEWMILCFLYFKDEIVLRHDNLPTDGYTAQKGSKYSFYYIWIVISLVVVLQFMQAFALEQGLGIICDYFLLIAFFELWVSEHNQSLKNLWRIGLIGAFSHFGQIWTLVIATQFAPGGVFGGSLNLIILASGAITFYTYSNYAIEWERLEDLALGAAPHDNAVRAPGQRDNHRWWKFLVILGASVVLGEITIFGGLLIPECK